MSENPTTNAARPSRVRFVVLAALCIAAALSYVSRNAIAVAESTVRADLGLSKEQSGWLMSAFFISYSLCQIPGATFGQRFGAQRALPLFSIIWSLATAATALGGFVNLLVTRVVKGVSQAGLFPVCTAVIARWFPKTGQALALGTLGGFMSVGGALGAALTGWLVVAMGWRWMFVLYSLPGVLWAAWFWFWFRDVPSSHPSVNAGELLLLPSDSPATAGASAKQVPWMQLATSPAMWWISSQQFFRAAGYMFFTSWFATYLQEAKGVTIVKSGLLTMLPLLAVLAGGLTGGQISDTVLKRTGNRKLARQGLAIISLVLCAAFTLSASLFDNALAAVLIISGGSFFASVAAPCGYAITIDMGDGHVATVNSIMNMCGNFGAMLFPLVVPWLIEKTGNWDAVLAIFGCLYLAAALCWWLLKPEGSVVDQALVRSQ